MLCWQQVRKTVRYLPINLLQAGAVGTLAETTVAHLVLRASVSHFLPPALAVRASATVLRLCRPEGWLHLGRSARILGNVWGRRRAVQGTGKIDSSPPARFGVSPHARPHTHVAPLRHPRADGQRTNTNAICQPSFISLSYFLRSHSAGRAGALRCSSDGFNGFLHTLEFFRASSPFSRISMHTYTRNTPNTLSK
uniref:(northern house mosquito) hypothetical protein n=1 Tax=Culex pipiens TaxID=7175 RepID=A0A8D8D6S9_CULPI